MSGFEASWGGIRFQAVNYRDGRMLRAPGYSPSSDEMRGADR